MSANNSKINIITWNSKSIQNKSLEFFNFMLSNSIHIGLICETWLNSSVILKHQHFNVYRKDRLTTSGGGVAIIIRKGLKHELLAPLKLDLVENIGISITLNDEKEIKLFSVYYSGTKNYINSLNISNHSKNNINKLFKKDY